jgi:hypothetical protein
MRQIRRRQIDAQQALTDTESAMVSAHACAESPATAETTSGWHASPGWASVLPNRLERSVIQGENCEIQG